MRASYLLVFLFLVGIPFSKMAGQERAVSEEEFEALAGQLEEVVRRKKVSEGEFNSLTKKLDYEKTKKVLKLRKKYIPKEKDLEGNEVKGFKGGGALLQLVAYFLMFALVAGILYMIFSRIRLDKKIDVEDKATLEEIEDIEDIDADAAYKAALAAEDYRLAIRMQFIKCLQILSGEEHIEWEKEKTNRDYAREINNTDLKRSFRELANVFERSWYGEKPVDRATFQYYDQKFLTFFNSMK